MGRKRLYTTEEERVKARQEKDKRYYERHREVILDKGRTKYKQQRQLRAKRIGRTLQRSKNDRREPPPLDSPPDPTTTALREIVALSGVLDNELSYDTLCVQALEQQSDAAIEAKLEWISEKNDEVYTRLNVILQHEGIGKIQWLKTYWVIHYREAIIKGRKQLFFEQLWFEWFGRFPIEVSPIERPEVKEALKAKMKVKVKATLNWLRVSYWPAHAPKNAPIVISDDEEEDGEVITVSDDDDDDE
ncbi:hypothetical protein ONZ45_g4097 [Pleurotus djamor]|nr:hypothetical protein ONZ45_g4097 [Pleurotus djamor]